ncbi:MAG: HEPN domain-containing protein, partial [Lachnospiraceae bacterium]|nr:HEPN domain-containing protein [Lachnospiraceae bacterium]
MSEDEFRAYIDLCFYRIEKAAEDLKTAKNNYDSKDYRAANNRAYYSIFHSLRAVLALDHFDSKKHSGIIAEFRRKYMKNRIYPVEMSEMIDSAFEIRNASDYNDMFIANKNETKTQIENAEYVLKEVEKYIGLPISAYKDLLEKEGEEKDSEVLSQMLESFFSADKLLTIYDCERSERELTKFKM